MTSERWLDIVNTIKDQFGVEAHETCDLPADEGGGNVESVVFMSPLGKTKLEFETRPRVIDKKTLYSKRAGQETVVEYVYSDTETVHKMRAYTWDESIGDWSEISAERFETSNN